MNINFLKYKKIYFIFSAVLALMSISSFFVFGLKPGIDFTGGSILEIEYQNERPSNQSIRESLIDLNLGNISVQSTNDKGIILRTREISEEEHLQIIQKLKEKNEVQEIEISSPPLEVEESEDSLTGVIDSEESPSSLTRELEELRFESIGPVIGRELRDRTGIVIILSLLAILLYIAIAFRKLNFPIKSWQYGLASLIALFHDALIPLGIFSILGEFYQIEITIPVVVALLTVLGYSINNTVVVFDRIRENLLKRIGENYEDTVNISLNQTLTRSINTSLTTLFVLLAILFFGGETLRYFSLMLVLGIVSGTYSSFLLVSPLLVAWLKWRKGV